MSLKDALDGCERILHDEFKDYPERSLYMIGAIGEAKGKPEPVPPTAPSKPDSKLVGQGGRKTVDEAKVAGKPEAMTEPKTKKNAEAKLKAEPNPATESPAKAIPVGDVPPETKPQPKIESSTAS